MLPADPTKLPTVLADLEDESNSLTDFDIIPVSSKWDLVKKTCSFTKLHQIIPAVFIVFLKSAKINDG